jgi:hypothetical protein
MKNSETKQALKMPRLTDPDFVYVKSKDTDIRKTFDRARKLQMERGMAEDLRSPRSFALAPIQTSELFDRSGESSRECSD